MAMAQSFNKLKRKKVSYISYTEIHCSVEHSTEGNGDLGLEDLKSDSMNITD